MSLGGILLGIINIAIVVAILILVGLVIVWFMGWLGFPVPANIQKVFMAIIALIALYMLVALLLGMPTVRLFHAGAAGVSGAAAASVPTGTAAYL